MPIDLARLEIAGMTMDRRTLRSDEPLAVELTAAVKHGEVDRLSRLLLNAQTQSLQ